MTFKNVKNIKGADDKNSPKNVTCEQGFTYKQNFSTVVNCAVAFTIVRISWKCHSAGVVKAIFLNDIFEQIFNDVLGNESTSSFNRLAFSWLEKNIVNDICNAILQIITETGSDTNAQSWK